MSLALADGITTHTIVVCVNKRERSIPLQTLLTKMGHRVVTCLCLYDALKVIAQEMPHLVICEAKLSDGNAGTLYDRINQNQLLKNTPILVNVVKKSKEELLPLKGRNLAGILVGPIEGPALTAKINEILASFGEVSPYFLSCDQASLKPDLTLGLDATIVGVSNGQVVSKSDSEIDALASLVCVPGNENLSPVLVKSASNVRHNDSTYNLFPMSRIKGKGRKWVSELPEVNIESSGGTQSTRKVLFYEPSPERFQQFKQIFSGYDIELIHATSLNQAAMTFRRDFAALACSYFSEMVTDSSSIVWKEAYQSVDEDKRPPVVIATSSLKARSTPETRYIKKPFGVGQLVETFEAAFERGDNISKVADVAQQTVKVSYQAPAKLIGLDETGGILQIAFPINPDSQVEINHPGLKDAWGGQTKVTITQAAIVSDQPDKWQVRFSSVGAGNSKAKYWERLTKHFSNQGDVKGAA